jgi:hypothetical protein
MYWKLKRRLHNALFISLHCIGRAFSLISAVRKDTVLIIITPWL